MATSRKPQEERKRTASTSGAPLPALRSCSTRFISPVRASKRDRYESRSSRSWRSLMTRTTPLRARRLSIGTARNQRPISSIQSLVFAARLRRQGICAAGRERRRLRRAGRSRARHRSGFDRSRPPRVARRRGRWRSPRGPPGPAPAARSRSRRGGRARYASRRRLRRPRRGSPPDRASRQRPRRNHARRECLDRAKPISPLFETPHQSGAPSGHRGPPGRADRRRPAAAESLKHTRNRRKKLETMPGPWDCPQGEGNGTPLAIYAMRQDVLSRNGTGDFDGDRWNRESDRRPRAAAPSPAHRCRRGRRRSLWCRCVPSGLRLPMSLFHCRSGRWRLSWHS